MFLYYTTTSLNFNNIFSSESISPESIYSLRGFGFNNYENLYPALKDHLLLFDKAFLLENDFPNSESYLIVFEFKNLKGVVPTQFEGVYLLNTTIYLNQEILNRVLFLDESAKDKTLARSESSRNVKFVDKYLDRFEVDNSLKDAPIFSEILTDPKIAERDRTLTVQRERLVNSIKGLNYCYVLGSQFSAQKPNYLLEKKLIEIKNDFAVLKNELSTAEKKSYQKDKAVDKDNLSELKRKLDKTLKETELFYKKNIEQFTDADFVSGYLKENFGSSYKGEITDDIVSLVITVIKSISQAYANFERKAIIWQLDNHSDSPALLFYALKTNFDLYYKSGSRHFKQDLDSDVVKLLFEIEKRAATLSNSSNKNITTVKNVAFKYVNDNGSISILDKNIEDSESIERLMNIIFRYRKSSREKVADTALLPMVEEVGDELYKKGSGKMTQLYKFLSHDLPAYNEPERMTGLFKNFSAFALNPNDVDRLTDYLNVKGVKDSHLAFSLFGLFNGIASMPKNIFSNILSKDNQSFTQAIDQSIAELLNYSVLKEVEYHNVVETRYLNEPSPEQVLNESKIIPAGRHEHLDSLDFEKLKVQSLSNVKWNIKKLPIDFDEKFLSALAVIEMEINDYAIPAKSQHEFLRKKLLELLTTSHKMERFGDKKVQKIVDIIVE